jgi:hypothetical protein
METSVCFFIIYRSFRFTMMFQTKVVETIKTYIYVHYFFFFENRAICEILWKNTVERQATDDDMAHAHCMLGT